VSTERDGRLSVIDTFYSCPGFKSLFGQITVDQIPVHLLSLFCLILSEAYFSPEPVVIKVFHPKKGLSRY
jgi:hypothetical protein